MIENIEMPVSFELFGSKWIVIFDDDYLENKSCYGESSYDERIIRLQKKSRGKERSIDGISQTFYHELTHAILDSMKEHDLSSNEKFVDLFGALLHQSIKTLRYDPI